MKKLFVFFVVLVPLLLITGIACGFVTGEGVVDHKAITGVRDGTSFEVLINCPSDDGSPIIVVSDKDLLHLFAAEEKHAIISDALVFEIESKYDRVNYVVNLAPVSSPGGGTQPYFTSWEIFNQLRVGETAKFKADGSKGIPKMEKLIGVP